MNTELNIELSLLFFIICNSETTFKEVSDARLFCCQEA